MKNIFLIVGLFLSKLAFCQTLTTNLETGIKKIEQDPQFKHAILSMYVVDSKTGKVVFDKNSNYGLAPASCQKVITSASAFELLGKEYRYKTYMSLAGEINENGVYRGLIMIKGEGDPSLGSNRYLFSKPNNILGKFSNALKEYGIKKIDGIIRFDDVYGTDDMSMPPKGYIWEDMGNYYGANSWLINWRENQFDIIFKSGSTNRSTEIKQIFPIIPNVTFINKVRHGEIGSGDEAYINSSPYATKAYITGTIPPNKDGFVISGSMPHPSKVFAEELKNELKKKSINIDACNFLSRGEDVMESEPRNEFELTTSKYFSPVFDSLNYWFLKKSVNLYGETFVKTIGQNKTTYFSLEDGITTIKNLWKQKGVNPSAINIIDGSGLSPANRVTTNALVTVMQYAKKQNWFSSFYNALPEMNGIKMKDGYISGVRSYTGYIKSKSGNEYTFALIVNNFDGSPATVREKLWKVLDVMK
ncbi:MAG: D-alanyl-D-alanine carboxypeptidase/D-alanyl-D-alanine-endopeptidase [Ferruginibacter sp.]|nr:D-alanyl-D-alanine carboxypeptidase/D-alanyl-D-alanine-endopeptidase [Ferruginibacter sp.]